MNNPNLFDLKLLRFRQKKSIILNNYDNFLHKEVGERLTNRIKDVNKNFEKTLEITNKPELVKSILEENNFFFSKKLTKYFISGIGGNIEINQELIPISENSIDLAISNLTFHWANDLVGILYQIKQILKPDGFFLASLFGEDTLIELKESFQLAENEILGKINNRISPFIDIKTAGNLLQRCGFKLCVSDKDKIKIKYKSPLDLLNDLRDMGETNILLDREKTFLRKDILKKTIEIYGKKFLDKSNKISATFDIIYLSGWKHHESQQKPLKPGSGKVSLSRILNK